ncbi:MAG: hypothetical protein KAU01_00540, partial [Candidatus Cloacimonetes bacterium]|nr:hypothetical protein [Candidatus Cloacimonadota bacterium]
MKKILISLVIILFPLSFLLFPFNLSSIEVGGHLTEDTIWSPVNNPYLVIDNIFVDSGVTLTILPGTVIKIQSAPLTGWQDYDDYFWYQNGNNLAKLFWVNGRIIAEGTQQDSIIFTRMEDDFDHYWGCIYIPEEADMCRFKHCRLEFSGSSGIWVGRIAKGAITLYNGLGIFENNTFWNNVSGLLIYYHCKTIEVAGNKLGYDDNINSFAEYLWKEQLTVAGPDEGYKTALVAGNEFFNDYTIYVSTINFVDNYISYHPSGWVISCQGYNDIAYFYDNSFYDCD